MGYVTKEQVTRAREMTALEYVLRYEGDKLKRVGGGFRLKDHNSLAVSDKGFYWHSKGIGGITALDYLMYVRAYDFVSAVCHIINQIPCKKAMSDIPQKQGRAPPANNVGAQLVNDCVVSAEHGKLILPKRFKNNNQIIAYLQNRGIDRDLIMESIHKGVLYESTPYHNCVFLGRDENFKIRSAALRGIYDDFKRDAEGSDKRYAFMLPPSNLGSNCVMMFESAIDCLSHQTLCKHGYIDNFDGYRQSLGGTSSIAAMHFLKRHPEVTHCIIAVDNDRAGNELAAKVANEVPIKTARVLPTSGIDWNEALIAAKQIERRSKPIAPDSPEI